MNFKKLAALAVVTLASVGMVHADWAFRDHRYSSLKATPADDVEVMFVGNSITNMHEWWEAFGSRQHIAGRGNSGGLSQEILDNLESYIDGKPKKLFLMIGTNDIGRAGSTATAELTAKRIYTILRRIQLESPETKIYMQSILPRGGMNGAIPHANSLIASYCEELGVEYVDLTELMAHIADDSMWSNDQLHPQTKGYSAWTHFIEPQVGYESVYPLPEEITSYKGVAAQSNASRTGQFPYLPVNEGDILIFGDDLVHGGEWHELLGSPKAKDRGTHWGTGGINLIQGKDAIKNTLEDKTTKPAVIIINYGEGGKDATNYRLLIDQAKASAPEARIFCMSLPPRSEENAADVANKNFNDNTVKVAAQEKGVGYIDIYTPLSANRGKYIMQGSYISGPGYAVIANEIAKALNDPDLRPVDIDATDQLIQRRTNRSIIGDKLSEAIMLRFDIHDPELLVDLDKAIETAAKAITNTLTTAQARSAAEKLEDAIYKTAGANVPLASTDEETHWYVIRSVRQNRTLTAEDGKLYGRTDDINPSFTFGHNAWKLLEREDGTYDIVNMRGEYINSDGVANDAEVATTLTQPEGGWDFDLSSHTTGAFVIFSDAAGNAQLNQSNQAQKNYSVLNWHPAGTYPILTDEGSSFLFEDYFGEMIDPLETGWYRISLEEEGVLPEGHGNHLVNADAERRQNASNFYPIRYDVEQPAHPAKEFIYLTVNGSSYRFSSINGHGVQENCTASRSFIPSDGPGVTIADNGNYILTNWHTYPLNNICFLGKSSGKSHQFAFSRVSDEELAEYDVWTVDLTAKNHTEVGKDVSVSLSHPDNKGLETVFNGGKYFLPVGSEITPEQLSFTVQNQSAQALEDPFVHIDPENKVIQIDYTQIPTIPVSSVELDREILELEAGKTHYLIATVNPADATEQTIQWTSSNTAVATVDEAGMVSAVSAGSATVTAACGGESAQCQVTVVEATIAISEITSDSAANPVYDLQGRKVINPSNGLYIENNKLIRK